MKRIKYSITCILTAMLFYGCDQGIDGITEVDPGPDMSAPQIEISSPTDGSSLKVNEQFTSVDINFEASDDIELGTVRVVMDGTEVANYNSFKDYRRFIVDDLVYDGIGDGAHELAVTATDLDGKSTTTTSSFTKEPAYIPKYAGEILYMSFDGDYTDLISFQKAGVEGDPGFNDESLNGPSAYAGALNSYLTLTTEELTNPEFSAIFWLNLNDAANREGLKRAGLLVMSPPMTEGGTRNDLTKGFRLFREEVGGNQVVKLNVGSGETGHWFDGGQAAALPNGEWANVAFTLSADTATVYINGQVVSTGLYDGVDWTDCNILSIMSGDPNFTQWNHWSDQSLLDDLRIFNRVLSQEEVQQIIGDDSGEFVSSYPPTFPGEMFYMPFDGDYNELFRDEEATVVGTPGFAGEAVAGSDAYAGVADSYLTFPADIKGPIATDEFSATFWYNVNADPDRGGILVMAPEDTEREGFPEVQNLRTSGFRFFREGDATRQVFKLNVGNGTADSWFDGGDAAAINPATAGWVHLAFTISGTDAAVYLDGEVAAQGSLAGGVDWTGVDFLSIGSGAPRFTQWNHLSDPSFIDELRLYNKALSQEEVRDIMDHDM
ncbi:MAG: LamG domain-containing protein [Bacteroidota bacterium]